MIVEAAFWGTVGGHLLVCYDDLFCDDFDLRDWPTTSHSRHEALRLANALAYIGGIMALDNPREVLRALTGSEGLHI